MPYTNGVYTPDAGDAGLVLPAGLSVVGGKIVMAGGAGGFVDEFASLDAAKWDSLNAIISNGKLTFQNAGSNSWTNKYIRCKAVLNNVYWEAVFEFLHKTTAEMANTIFNVNTVVGGLDAYIQLQVGYQSAYGGLVASAANGTPIKIKMVHLNGFLTLFLSYNGGEYFAAHGRVVSIGATHKISFFPYMDNTNFLEIERFYLATAPTDLKTVLVPEFTVANLSGITSITHTLDATGCSGTVTAYAEHYNDVLGTWCSLSDSPGVKTLLGSGAATFTTPVSGLVCRAGEKMRLTYTAISDGTMPAPSFGSHTITYAQDSVVPSTVTIKGIVSVVDGTAVGYAFDFTRPLDAITCYIETRTNGGAWVPWGTSAGSRECVVGLVVGDTVQVRIAGVDAVGNQGAWEYSSTLTIEGTIFVPVFVQGVTFQVDLIQQIKMVVR